MTWVLESLAAADEQFIVSNRSHDTYDVPVYKDLTESQSPLSGLHTALHYAQHDWVAVAACDLPYLSASYWQALAVYRRDYDAVVVRRTGWLEPLAAFYHKRILDRAEHCLDVGSLALHKFVASLEAKVLVWDDLDMPNETLRNINRQDDLV